MLIFKIRLILVILLFVAAVICCEKQEIEEAGIIFPQLEGEVLFVQDYRVRCANINYMGSTMDYGESNYDSYPKWSNDGTKFAFILLNGDVDSTYFIFKIVEYNSGNVSEWKIGNSRNINIDWDLSWSPDDKTVIFLGKDYPHHQINYFNTQTGDTIQTFLNLKYNQYCTALAWNPIDYKIAVVIGSNSIWMIEPYKTTPVKQFKIETDPGGVEYLDWNFDGTKLLYSGSGYGNIFVTDADGSNNYMIPEIFGFAPCWSKNGRFIMYQGPAGIDGNMIIPGLFATDLNGSFEQLILKNAINPDWR